VSTTPTNASDLLRSLGLLVDGPARWTNPVASRAPGVFVVELPGGALEAPLDTLALRRWLERVPELRLDGGRPSVPELRERLAEFWLPMEPILYVGRAARAIGQRLAAIYATPLGDARPAAAGHWLKALSVQGELRVWWAETDAHEEFEDAILTEIAARNAVNRPAPVLPFANLTATDGLPRAHGLTNSLLSDTSGAPRPAVAGITARRTAAPRARRQIVREPAPKPRPAATHVSRDGLDRLTAELEELRTIARPQIIARVAAARELGDLRENADYEYARKEQSFIEGRIQALEHALRTSVVIEQPAQADVVHLGSTVVVESDGERQTYAIVGSTEAKPAAGRLSNASPVGRALMGARAGDEVIVELPVGTVTYRVIEVGSAD
jgi:transcription elongation factor GreA